MSNIYTLLILVFVLLLLAVVLGEGIRIMFGEDNNENKSWRKLPKDDEAIRNSVHMRKEILTPGRQKNSKLPKVSYKKPHKVDIDSF